MHRVTISSLARAEACAPSAVIPAPLSLEPESKPARIGHVIHAYLRDVNLHGRERALELAPEEHWPMLESLEVERLPLDPAKWAVEVAYAYNWRTGAARELWRGRDRPEGGAYPTTEDEISGTADVEGEGEDCVHVADYKSGRADLGEAADSPQLLGYAVAARAVRGKRRAVVEFLRIRPGDGAVLPPLRAELSRMELDAAVARIREIMLRVKAFEAMRPADIPLDAYATGPHCKWCPANGVCPARVGILAPLAPELRAEVEPAALRVVVSEENAAALFRTLTLAREAVEAAWARFDEYAHGHPVALDNGEFYAPVEKKREVIDPALGAIVLMDLFSDHGRGVAERAVQVKHAITQESLRRALRWMMGRVKGLRMRALLREAMAALRARGAVRVASTWTQLEVHRPIAGTLLADAEIEEEEEAA
jgi:hypothetical protein